MHIPEFKPWLIQRVALPIKMVDNTTATLAAYYSTAKTPELYAANKPALDVLNGLIPLDYMGSAEFEFGAIPETLRNIVASKADLVPFTIKLEGRPYTWEPEAKEAAKVQPIQTATLHGWCLKGHEKELTEFLKKEAHEDSALTGRQLKERTNFQEICFGELRAVRNKNGTISKRKGFQVKPARNCALLDLDNLWYVTTSQEQLKGLQYLLGIIPGQFDPFAL